MMTHSHPNRWAFGGVLVWIDWTGSPAHIDCWRGDRHGVARGDAVLALRTGFGITAVTVEHSTPGPQGAAACE